MARTVPSLADFTALAAEANVIPLHREVIADGETPVSAFAKLGRGPGSFLLESLTGGEEWARYSFLGLPPRARLTVGGGEARLERFRGRGAGACEVWAERDPALALRRLLAPYRAASPGGLPRFVGGAVGYLAYDAVRAWEPIAAPEPPRAVDDLQLPDADFVLADHLVVFDHLRQTVLLVVSAFPEEDASPEAAYRAAEAHLDDLTRRLAAPAPPLPALDLEAPVGPFPTSRTGRRPFLAAVGRIHEHILAGDAFQVVLSQRFEAPRLGTDPFAVYRALRVLDPSPYLYHLELPSATVTGASPETLVRLDGGRVEVRPIAGTRRRGRDAESDAALAEELRRDEKENAEHVMLIDLGRNDVGRVARLGTVRVEADRVIERYAHVMHLVSLVSGELAADRSAFDVLRAAFPAGTLSGAPKVRAMQIIDHLEPVRRGIYGGAVGYVGFPGPGGGTTNLDLAIAIRTLVTVGDRVLVQAGAGVVLDSVAEAEHEETVAKARAVVRALEVARGAGR